MALTDAQVQAVKRDITHFFGQAASAAMPIYSRYCTVIPSSSLDEKYGFLGASPGMREWLGDRHFNEMRAADYTLANKAWESSLKMDRFTMEDDRYGGLQESIGDLAEEAVYHPDELLFDIINAGESGTCFDGQFFYDTDHSWGDSGTQSNDLTYNAADHTDVTPLEFKKAFNAALKAMLAFKNDRGKYFIRPTAGKLGNIVCRVPLALYDVAVDAFESQLLVKTAGDGAETNVLIEKPDVQVIQYMGAGTTGGSDVKFDIDFLGGRLKPFVFQARSPLRFEVSGQAGIEFKDVKAMTEARYNVGYLMWPFSVRTTFN